MPLLKLSFLSKFNLNFFNIFCTFGRVKKFISIIILATYLCSFTEFNELLKLPLLLEHFSKHNAQNKSLSFSEFLCMHYLDTHDNDGDDDSDRSLPFKSHDNCIHGSSFNLYVQTNNIHIKTTETDLQNTLSQEKEFFYPSFSANIWQPPKL